METNQIITLFSSVGLGAILSAILVFVNNSKRNQLDYITRERSEWRKKIENIIEELQDTSNHESVLARLKSQINPYGYNLEIKNTKFYFMKDGHIWDSIADGKYEDTIYFLELLLKFDWERKKQEAKFHYSIILFRIMQIFSGAFSLYLFYLAAQNLVKNLWSQIALGGLTLSIFLIILQGLVIDGLKINPSKNDAEKKWLYIIFFATPFFINWGVGINYTDFLKNPPIAITTFLGIYIYMFHYLSLVTIRVEDDYVEAIERFLKKPSTINNKASRLNNEIIRLESKVYSFDNRKINLESLEKKRRKLKKKLVNKNQPNKFQHPIQFYCFLKNKKRISKLVLRMLN
ncbi:hypothetical protein FFV08_03155 [Streptococcus sanguinis]|uniref:Uncharacterized protein n=1 Tax=Streptococcus sanguinis TaxID=1305 RepID=A0A7H8V5D1_STRSA|nr:hypothetical protein FFV08_03155 [Streptococcus sanguinis]